MPSQLDMQSNSLNQVPTQVPLTQTSSGTQSHAGGMLTTMPTQSQLDHTQITQQAMHSLPPQVSAAQQAQPYYGPGVDQLTTDPQHSVVHSRF